MRIGVWITCIGYLGSKNDDSFFFQAEDGILDRTVTGVQTCALPIFDRAGEEAETPMPGYTHLQRAIPVTLGHHLLAWVEMLERDRARFRFVAGQARPSPLGAGEDRKSVV